MTEIVKSSRGGKQSKIKTRPTELPPIGTLLVSQVMGNGSQRYPREEDGTPNWHRIDFDSNLDHAIEHLLNFCVERNKADRNYDVLMEELSHAGARILMALEQYAREVYPNDWHDYEETL
jgi:hypothetical protein